MKIVQRLGSFEPSTRGKQSYIRNAGPHDILKEERQLVAIHTTLEVSLHLPGERGKVESGDALLEDFAGGVWVNDLARTWIQGCLLEMSYSNLHSGKASGMESSVKKL